MQKALAFRCNKQNSRWCFAKCLIVAITALLLDDGHWSQKLLMPPCSGRKQAETPHFSYSQPYCPLSCSVPLSVYLWSYISDFAILFCCSTYTCRQRWKEESVRLLVKNCRHTHRQGHTQVLCTHCLYHLQNICLPSNVASKAVCYLDCISFLMFQLWYGTALLWWTTHPPATVSESLQASVLHVPTIWVSFWLSG